LAWQQLAPTAGKVKGLLSQQTVSGCAATGDVVEGPARIEVAQAKTLCGPGAGIA
jgi:hypothetical protein